MDVDLEELAAIVELLEKADFSDFRYDKGDLHIAVRRGGLLPEADDRPVAAPVAPAPRAPGPAPTAVAPVAAAASPDPQARSQVRDGDVVVTSPMLGAFYRSPKPGEPPFVQVGDRVEADTLVCIVEVMKLMNSVPAGVVGEIVAVHAADGDLVEYEQPLFVIRPAA